MVDTGSGWAHLLGSLNSLPLGEGRNRNRARAGSSNGWSCLEETSPDTHSKGSPKRAQLVPQCSLAGEVPEGGPRKGRGLGQKAGMAFAGIHGPSITAQLEQLAGATAKCSCGQDRPSGYLGVAHAVTGQQAHSRSLCPPGGEAGVYPGIREPQEVALSREQTELSGKFGTADPQAGMPQT